MRSHDRWKVKVAGLVGTAGRYVDTHVDDAVVQLAEQSGNDPVALETAATVWAARTDMLPTAHQYSAVLHAAAAHARHQ